MTNPTVAFSIVAQEAWGHKTSDGESEDAVKQNDEQYTSQRNRRRLKVRQNSFDVIQI